MSYPQIIEYNDAVQNPRSFSDAELRKGSVAETPLGLPLALSGGFALTYIVEAGSRKYAVRCFHREVPEAQQRYAQISKVLQSLNSPYFVHFDFQASGIAIGGRQYPVVKMDWVEGDTLGMYLDRWASKASAVASLQQGFSNLADYLERNGIAHGDIQNENVIVAGNSIRLIDYDGMFVPGMKEGVGAEVGHKHFQHPARDKRHFGPKMDRFSFIVLDTSLGAIQSDPSLHKRFREGGQAIVFKANDFASPDSSEAFRLLDGIPALRDKAKGLAAICKSAINDVPTLADFRAGRNIPTPTAPPITTNKQPAPAAKYIGAFYVLDASDFGDVLKSVGDKVELVGKIVSVKQGVGKRGRGRGRPYVFINFGQWNKESVKITIWSEGLNNMTVRPNDSWVGKWISVTGLLEPPYEGRHYGKAYRSVGITVDSDNQIIHIPERDARFRLNQAGSPTPAAPISTEGRNKDILTGIKGGKPIPPKTNQQRTWPINQSPASAPLSTKDRNAQILKGIMTPSPTQPNSPQWPHQQHGNKMATGSSQGAGILAKVPFWVWVIGGFVLLYLLNRK